MTEQKNQLASLFAACWKDEALKARFQSDPKAVLAEHGIAVPANMNVNVVENSDNTVHITMPQAPAGDGELLDDELTNVAGGIAPRRRIGNLWRCRVPRCCKCMYYPAAAVADRVARERAVGQGIPRGSWRILAASGESFDLKNPIGESP